MTDDEVKAICRGIAPAIKKHVRESIAEVGTESLADIIVSAVKAATAPFENRIAALEARGYKGLHTPGTGYSKGDSVTFDGSLWIARDSTFETPGDGATKWQLAAKRGRDARR
jgi:hypothetical protein